ncbi:MAG: carboxypeptidase regulatory-like domain-containing protein [Bacteroidota bacterium]
MNYLKLLSVVVLLGCFTACETDSDDDAVISGEVTDSNSGNPLAGATVTISAPENLTDFAQTDSSGAYSIGGLNVNDVTQLTLVATALDYNSLNRNVTITPGEVQNNVNFELTPEDDPVDEPDEVSGSPDGAAAIILEQISREFINIRQTGGEVNATFTFEVQDSSGRAISAEGAVDVEFVLLSSPGGGESVIPNIVRTNSSGRAVTSIFSGDSAGVVRLQARIFRDELNPPLEILSSPVIISINGGFPSPDRFFVATDNRNVEGYGLVATGTNLNYPIVASVGDRFGNPVRPGTAVSFRTVGGGIIEGSSLTDNFGSASVLLRPDGSTPQNDPRGIGFFRVFAETVDENNTRIERELNMLFTTRTANISINPVVIDVPSNQTQSFSYEVTDLNGYPMAAGTTISLQASQGLAVTGDANLTLNDFFDPGPGRTQFNAALSDSDDDSNDLEDATLSIVVTTPNTGSQTRLSISGTKGKGGIVFDSRSAVITYIDGLK